MRQSSVSKQESYVIGRQGLKIPRFEKPGNTRRLDARCVGIFFDNLFEINNIPYRKCIDGEYRDIALPTDAKTYQPLTIVRSLQQEDRTEHQMLTPNRDKELGELTVYLGYQVTTLGPAWSTPEQIVHFNGERISVDPESLGIFGTAEAVEMCAESTNARVRRALQSTFDTLAGIEY